MDKNLKFKIISEGSKYGVSKTCKKYNISRTLYYRWLHLYKSSGIDSLDTTNRNFIPKNKTNIELESLILNLIKEYPSYGPRAIKYLFDESGYNLSESAIYNIMKRNNLNKQEYRLKYSKNKETKISAPIPTLNNLGSGECWIFWINDYGYFDSIGQIYEYTFFDLKSKIACSRLYDKISFTNFEDVLTSTAMPIAKTLNLKINHLCFFKDDKLIKNLKKSFKSNITTILSNNGFDFNINILLDSNSELDYINKLKKEYTQVCISFIIQLVNQDLSFLDIKFRFQDYIRNYNLNYKYDYDLGYCSPVTYHNKSTNTKLILPIWAYIYRKY